MLLPSHYDQLVIIMFICRWVREFLDDQNQGLDHLIEYLSFRLVMMRHEQRISESRNSSEERLAGNMTAGGSSVSGIIFLHLSEE
jgi:hypothetical protein